MHYGEDVLQYYNMINPAYGAARADLFRYLMLYRFGGIYIDIKSTFLAPIDDAIDPADAFIISQWRQPHGHDHAEWGAHKELSHVPGGEFQQWHIIASPGHPFLRAVIQRVLSGIHTYSMSRFGFGQKGVLRLTGPIAYTLAIEPILNDHPHRMVDNETSIGLQYSIFPGQTHRSFSQRHYTTSTSPIVLRRGVGGAIDRCYRGGYVAVRRARNLAKALRSKI